MNRKKFLCSKLFNIVLSEIREELETFTDQKIFFCSVNGCNFLCFLKNIVQYMENILDYGKSYFFVNPLKILHTNEGSNLKDF